MATLKVTPSVSPSSLTISGTTQVSATISWTCPTVPANATISSCVLTGVATATMSKGNATIKVNGTTVTSGNTFTINLGTANTTNSVAVTGVGGNKNAAGTVTFSNLTYTVDYTETLPKYTVTFLDWDGTVLKTQEVEEGSSATAPVDPTRDGYSFIGWDVSFSNITSDLTVTAQYVEIAYTSLRVKENGVWTPIFAIYKKIGNIWVIQDDFEALFSQNNRYSRYPDIPTAILYSDGTLIFSNNERVDSNHGDIVNTYIGWDKKEYSDYGTPWYDDSSSIKSVRFNNIKPQNLAHWFQSCSNLASFDSNGLDTSNVTNMNAMFNGCADLTSLDLSSLDTSNVTNMGGMFNYCSNLTSLDLSSLDTSNVTNMGGMFNYCSNLTSLDLSSLDTSNVTNMSYMFSGCTNLTSLDLSSFDTSKEKTYMSRTFDMCDNLQTIYARTEADAERFRLSLPSTATVIVGSPS